jgi:oligoendopeptidase F
MGIMRKKLSMAVRVMLGLLLCLIVLAGGCTAATQDKTGEIPSRDDIAAQYKWKLEDIYASNSLWEEDFTKAQELMTGYTQYEGKLGQSAANLLACLQLDNEASQILDKLYQYAAMRSDEDLENTTYKAMTDRADSLYTSYGGATAFISPEILGISDTVMEGFQSSEPGLAVYKHFLDELTRVKLHVLPAEQEKIVALAGEVMGAPGTIFSMMNDADFTWPTVKNEDGKEVELSNGNFGEFLESPDRQVRKNAYEAMYTPYESFKNTLAALFSTEVKTHIFYAKSQGYDSSIQSALDGPNIPVEVYNNLVLTVNDNLEPVHRWADLIKETLKVDELHVYDTYVPLFSASAQKYTWEEAKEVVIQALSPLGPEYVSVLKKAFSEGWIDVYETKNKTSGAYSWGPYGVHPYILLNFGETLSIGDILTLSHELGHSLHSYFSEQNQPYLYSGYATFCAEVASTTNEALLMNYLLKNAADDNEKLAMLQTGIEGLQSTFYRQTRFAEFEMIVNADAEKGVALTPDYLNQQFGDLVQKYWGDTMVVDPQETLSWARIPHFYRNFYVYTYATSYAAAQAISQNIINQGEPAVNAYLEFLGSGSSDYPIELLKRAGADMSSPEPFVKTAELMNSLIDQVVAIQNHK